jgi:hypothetical protein
MVTLGTQHKVFLRRSKTLFTGSHIFENCVLQSTTRVHMAVHARFEKTSMEQFMPKTRVYTRRINFAT